MSGQISDSASFESPLNQSGWRPDDGWYGIIPGRSTLAQAIQLLGQPTKKASLANAESFEFLAGIVRVSILDDQPYISKIWISRDINDPRLVPTTIEEARRLFGTLKATRRDQLVGIIFERPGMRIACNPSSPERIEWMEVYRPGS